jgi:acyl carrier protein phosphodiesterase
MNYLAHSYLNGKRGNDVLMGNMMGDFVKGKQYQNFEAPIQEGILLHRAIDTFTDAHPIVSHAKSFFRQDYGLFSGPIVDVLFDYYLANDTSKFIHKEALQQHIQNTYNTILQNSHLMNEKMKHMTSYMIQYDWLFHYQFTKGIEKSWRGMSKRYERMNDAEIAIQLFHQHHDAFRDLYQELILDLEKEFML